MLRNVIGYTKHAAPVIAVSLMSTHLAYSESEKRKCPIDFLWNWGESKPTQETSHPIVKLPAEADNSVVLKTRQNTVIVDNEPPAAPERKCPVDFLWKWGGAKPELPFGHPEVKSNADEETPVKFNTTHYPDGVNSKFMTGDRQKCCDTFCGPKGLFEDTEHREIAKYAPQIISTLQRYGLRKGACVVDVGAGTGENKFVYFMSV